MFSRRLSQERYINPLTDFGFKRLFGTEPNKALLIDFLNVILPERHTISDLSYRNSENLGNTPIDRKAIFDIYCKSENGESFIVEIQKAKQNYFKDRSVYYSTFPIQEQAQQGIWDYRLSPVYTVGILDFVFDEHKDDDTILHTVELKDQKCDVFYDKLKFIYLELPKFKKTIEQLESHFDKWLFLLKHLPELGDPPKALQEQTFRQLFETAEIANFSLDEQDAYEDSLKYYRDLKNVVDTSKEEGREEGREEATLKLVIRLLEKRFGTLPKNNRAAISSAPIEALEALSEDLLDFADLNDLSAWLKTRLAQ
ncbi:MAG: Rpn family recombination-promoting nuclease/putative transposase [Cyanobacteria bacterium J06634_5]